MRLIDADDLIKSIDYSAGLGGALGKVVEVVKSYAKFMVQTAPTIKEQRTGKWILCSERLPEENTEVLVTSGECLFIAEYEVLSDGTRYWSETIEYRNIPNVTAWMPLPEPYKK